MSKGKLGVLEGLSLIKGGDRPHYLSDTQGVLDEANAEVELEDEVEDESVASVMVQSTAHAVAAIQSATSEIVIKLSGDVAELRNSLRHRDELLKQARALLVDLHVQLGDQQAMANDTSEPRIIAFIATLDGMGIK